MNRRFRTLVIPYLSWNLLAVLFMFVTMYLSGHSLFDFWQSLTGNGYLRIFWDCNHANATNSINAFGCLVPGGTPIDGPLWFLRDLIVLSCISPLIYWACKHLRCLWLTITCILYLLRIGIPVEGFSADGIFFFSLGAYMTVCKKDIFGFFGRNNKSIIIACCLLLIILCLSYFYDKECFRIIRYIFTIFGVGFVFLALQPIANKYSINQIKKNSQTSFFIFALHGLILYPCVKYPIGMLIWGNSELINLTRYLLTISLTLAICLGCFFCMKKITPRLLSFITGR